MLVPHPEFNDILVDVENTTSVISKDRINDYFYYKDNKMWCPTEIHTDSKPFTKEEYILHYCKNEEGKTIYNKSN